VNQPVCICCPLLLLFFPDPFNRHPHLHLLRLKHSGERSWGLRIWNDTLSLRITNAWARSYIVHFSVLVETTYFWRNSYVTYLWMIWFLEIEYLLVTDPVQNLFQFGVTLLTSFIYLNAVTFTRGTHLVSSVFSEEWNIILWVTMTTTCVTSYF
jgi:hypothetical protein